MNVEGAASLAGQISIIVGAFLAIAGAFKVVSSTVERVLASYRAWIRRRHVKGLLLKPTPEEMARYSVKLRQSIDPEEAIQKNRARQILLAVHGTQMLRAEARLITLAIFFLLGFLCIALRISYLSLLS